MFDELERAIYEGCWLEMVRMAAVGNIDGKSTRSRSPRSASHPLDLYFVSSNKGLGCVLKYLDLRSVFSTNKPKALPRVQILNVGLSPGSKHTTELHSQSHVIRISNFRPQAKAMTRTS